MDIKSIIKKRQKELGINNEELAKRMGVSPSTISRYLSGEINNMRSDKLNKLAKALEVDVSSFLSSSNDSLGDYDENVKHLSNNPELIETYESLLNNDNLRLLFDKSKDLSPSDLEKVLVIINTFIKEEDNN